MKRELKNLRIPISISDIDFRVQSINRGGYAVILAYKDARVDMNRLDDVIGVGNWQRDFKVIDNTLYCGVGIWNEDINDWVWKWDAGVTSYSDKEKGRASDAFKRACFNLGIGRELYEYPIINVKLRDDEWEMNDNKPRQTFNLKLKEWKWLSQFNDGKISFLAAKDDKGILRFKWGEYKQDLGDDYVRSIDQSGSIEHSIHNNQIIDNPVVEDEANISGILKKEAEVDIHPIKEIDANRSIAIDAYTNVFGSKPRANMKTETIIEKTIEMESIIANKAKHESKDLISSHEGKDLIQNKIEEDPIITFDLDVINEQDKESDLTPLIQKEVNKIPSFTDKTEFISWARQVVDEYNGMIDEEELLYFRNECNNHFKTM